MKGFLLLLSVGLTLSLHAAFSGEDFVRHCAGEGRDSAEFCDGLLFAYLTVISEKNICYRFPEGLSMDQFRLGVVEHVQNNPLGSDARASLLITQLLVLRYPCGREWPLRTAATSHHHNQVYDILPVTQPEGE